MGFFAKENRPLSDRGRIMFDSRYHLSSPSPHDDGLVEYVTGMKCLAS